MNESIKKNIVSIITPTYNSSKLIAMTIESVIEQKYPEWEMIIIDDCSTDDTEKIVNQYMLKDKRIKFIKLESNCGAGKARNIGLKNAKGRFIAYLDSDDIWYPDKLEKQTKYMLENNYGFTCTSYEVIGNDGEIKNKFIQMKKQLDYNGFLINNLIQTVGVMVDLKIIDKKLLEMPDMRRRQDAATWLQILKAGNKCYGMDEVLAKYRRTEGSLSSNKYKAIKGVWFLYRKVENLSLVFSIYCFIRYAYLAVWKRVYFKRG